MDKLNTQIYKTIASLNLDTTWFDCICRHRCWHACGKWLYM